MSGGSLTQTLDTKGSTINSISVIIGVDPEIAHINRPHPAKLVMRTEDNSFNQPLERTEIVNNAFSQFDLARPVDMPEGQRLILQIFNESDEPIGPYVKKPGMTELAPGVGEGVVVVGQVDRQSEHEMKATR